MDIVLTQYDHRSSLLQIRVGFANNNKDFRIYSTIQMDGTIKMTPKDVHVMKLDVFYVSRKFLN